MRLLSRRQKIPPLLKEGASYVIPVLEGVSAAADAFPPLKSAVGGVLFIARTVRGFRSNKQEWKEFATWVTQCGACVVVSVPSKPILSTIPTPPAASLDVWFEHLDTLNQ